MRNHHLRKWILPCLIFAACSGSNDDEATNQTLTRVTGATAVACPNGGITISTGVDINGDGVLESTEVASSQNVCNSPGAAPLASTTPLAVGDTHCPAGGTQIDIGLDNGAGGGTAGDGILQPGEVTSTQYVCNGGSPANPATIEGSVIISNSVDASKLVGVTSITGDLTIAANGLDTIDLSSLQSLGGSLTVSYFSGDQLSAASLTTIGGNIYIQNVPTLTGIAFPVLTSTGGSFGVAGNALLSAIDIPLLATTGGFDVDTDPLLAALNLPSLTSSAGFVVSNNSTLAALDLPSLAISTGHAQFVVSANPILAALDLPLLASTANDFFVLGNSLLATLDVPLLDFVGGEFDIASNSLLPTCEATALAAQCNAANANIAGNDDNSADCPL